MPNFSDNFSYYKNNEVIIDDFAYEYDDDVQDIYVEGGDGGNPTVRAASTTPNWKAGNTSVRFPITDSTHTSTWSATIGSIDLSEVLGVKQGTPLSGRFKVISARSSTSALTAFTIRIGSDSSNYIVWTPILPSTTAEIALDVDATSLSVTGTPDWTAVAYIQVRATSASGTPTLDLSGLRATASNRVTQDVWEESSTLAANGASLAYLTTKRTVPTLLMNGDSSTDLIVNKVNTLSFTNFTAYAKLRFHVDASGYEAGLALRIADTTTGSEDFYTVVIDINSDEIQLDKWVAGSRTTIQSKAFTVAVDTDYYIKVEASGSRFRVYCSTDGANYSKYLDATDSTMTSGSIGLFTRGMPVAEFYNVMCFDRPYVIVGDWSFAERGMFHLVNVQEDSAPVLDIDHLSLPATNKDTFLQKNWRSKYINVTGNITTSNAEDLTKSIDDFKLKLSQESIKLIYGKQTATPGVFLERSYTVNAIDLDKSFKRETWHMTYMPFVVTFQAPDGIAKLPSSLSTPSFAWDEYSFTRVINFKGSASPLPTLTYVLTDATPASGTINTMIITNTTTGRSITVTKSSAFSNSDIVTIDFDNRSVTINGTATDYTGSADDSFFIVGGNTINTVITGSSNINQSNAAPGLSYFSYNFGGGITGTSDATWLAQSFQVSSTTTYPRFDIYIALPDPTGFYSNPLVDCVLRVETDSAGAPSGSLVNAGATATIPLTSRSTAPQFQEFILTTAASLTASTTYWMVLKGANPGVFTNSIAGTVYTTVGSSYASGSVSRTADSGGSWVAQASNLDFSFKIYSAGPTGISGTFNCSYKPRYA